MKYAIRAQILPMITDCDASARGLRLSILARIYPMDAKVTSVNMTESTNLFDCTIRSIGIRGIKPTHTKEKNVAMALLSASTLFSFTCESSAK